MSFGMRSTVVIALAISLSSLLPTEARRSRHSSSSSASSTRHSSASSSRHSSAAHHSSRSVATHSSARSSRTARGSSHKHSIIGSSSSHHHVAQVVHHYVAPTYAEPHAENVQNTNSLTSIYHLYDRGVNERLDGRYDDAMKTLLEANNSYTSTQKNLTLEAMINYELGQAAEANNNYSLAADAYGRTLRIKPNMIDASIRLASLLMKAGHPELALSRAKEAVAMYPNDPRAHEILALILDKTGSNVDAKVERDSTKTLIKSGSSINTVPSNTGVDSVPSALQPGDEMTSPPDAGDASKGQMSTPETAKPLGAPVDNDVLP